MSTLYDDDLYSWATEQASALRAASRVKLNTPVRIDWDNLAEEVEDMAKSQLRELRSRYFRLLTHLLKWQFQAERRSTSWRGTIGEERRRIDDVFEESPSLRGQGAALFTAAYGKARLQAADETGLDPATFPEACPFTLEEAEDTRFWPDA